MEIATRTSYCVLRTRWRLPFSSVIVSQLPGGVTCHNRTSCDLAEVTSLGWVCLFLALNSPDPMLWQLSGELRRMWMCDHVLTGSEQVQVPTGKGRALPSPWRPPGLQVLCRRGASLRGLVWRWGSLGWSSQGLPGCPALLWGWGSGSGAPARLRLPLWR